MKNRSVPSDILLPHVSYQNPAEACEWLKRLFGFEENFRYGEPVRGIQIHLGQAYLMLNCAGECCSSPAQLGRWTQMLTVFVDDVDAHHAKAVAEGAKIVEELQETVYGERQFAVEDLEGHKWLFSQHARDVDPSEWGATVYQKQ
ncbi:MAG: VOC family protein [Terracidiphilus sp.]